MSPSHAPRPDASPRDALSSPWFLLALLVLGLNDHVLKGPDVLPGWLTGKLSDFAGLVVAPVVLAALVNARTRWTRAASCAAAAAFLGALQLWPAFVDGWAYAVGLVGIPWHNTADPTDLLALAVLPLTWRVMQRPTPGSRLGELVIWPTAATLLMATSMPVCDNATETTITTGLDEEPQIPGDMTGAEVLARVGGTHEFPLTYRSERGTCAELDGAPDTTVTVEIAETGATVEHYTVLIDDTVDTSDCRSQGEHTAVTVRTRAHIQSADGRIDIERDVTLQQVAYTSGEDADPTENRIDFAFNLSVSEPDDMQHIEALGLDTESVRGVGVMLTFDTDHATGFFIVDRSGDDEVWSCGAGEWDISTAEP